MKPFQPLSAIDQLAEHLRSEIFAGRIIREMPGINQLATILGCSPRTVIAAVKQLEHEGLITKQGAGKPSLITPENSDRPPALRIQMILYDREDNEYDDISAFILQIKGHLENAGHAFSFGSKTLEQLGMNVKRLARYMKDVDVDAWIISSGSREILQWLSEGDVPAFTLFGRRRGLPIAGVGPDKEGGIRDATRRLIELGHQRIVMLTRPSRRLPNPGLPERAFLETLEKAGIMTGGYNLPDWDGTMEGLPKILSETFRLTPPTAVVVDEPQIFISAQHELARRGILAPEHVSMVCTDQDSYFNYFRPSIAHVRYHTDPWARRITKWANDIAIGKDDRRQTLTKVTFVEGGTIGPAAKS